MGASHLLINEFFAVGDERFVPEVLELRDASKLKSLGEMWVNDRRAFARTALLRYVDQGGVDKNSHRALAKLIFKTAEKNQDDELMAHLLVAFDRFANRRMVTRTQYDWNTRTTTTFTALLKEQSLVRRRPKSLKNVPAWRRSFYEQNHRFSLVTRRYLQRRAWRYFRKLAWSDGARYIRSLSAALKLYPEESLDKPVRLLDSWGLMHALYWGANTLNRDPAGVDVASGKNLKDLAPAPYKPELWKDHFDTLLELFLRAKSNTVRQWALMLIRKEHLARLKSLPIETVRVLLRHERADAQELGAELLAAVTGLESMPVNEWVSFLKLENQNALTLIVQLVKKYVTPERLKLGQCVELARSPIAPVATLGFEWAKARPVQGEADLDALLPIAEAGVKTVRQPATEWLAGLILLNESPRMPERVRELLDSPFDDVRNQALRLMQQDKRFGESPLLWAAMAESPWSEVRDAMVAQLSERQAIYTPETLRAVWATSLLAIHRGGRAKRAVAVQVADRIISMQGEADALLPLLAIALRSIRAPERRQALAHLARATLRVPALRTKVEALLPELKLSTEGAWA
ncbi:MAG: hypothetical protein K1X64_12575 [Myxococcaceae bacterium]|nr:hypothetical protein [Myxococcaceae bacterium]